MVYLPSTEEVLEERARKIFRELRGKHRVSLKRPYATENRFVKWFIELYRMVAGLKFKQYCEVKVTLKIGKAVMGVERKGPVIVLFVDAYRSFKPKQLLKHYEVRVAK